MPSLETFLVIEATLADRLTVNLKRHINKKSKRIANRLSRGDISGAIREANKITAASSYRGLHKLLRQLMVMGLLHGSSRLTPVNDTQLAKTKKLPTEGRQIMVQLKAMIDLITPRLIRRALLLIDKFEQEAKGIDSVKLEKADIAIESILADELNGAGTNELNIAASLQSSRLSAYGYIIEAEVLNITHYTISEQLDRRTCPVCQIMHGKTFDVVEGRNKLDNAIRTTEVEELKSLSPWPKQDSDSVANLAAMSNADLVSNNFQTPPYHPMCRGLLVGVTEQLEVSTKIRTGTLSEQDQEDVTEFLEKWRLGHRNNIKNGIELGLDSTEALAIIAYTDRLYKKLNRYIRGVPLGPFDLEKSKLFDGVEKVLNAAIAKLPKYKGNVVRQVKIDGDVETVASMFTPGKTLDGSKNGFLSTSYDKIEFDSPSRGDNVFVNVVIHNTKSGASVSKVGKYGDDEKEILLPTTAKFKVKSTSLREVNGSAVLDVIMEEI